jgi:hypothetical protein
MVEVGSCIGQIGQPVPFPVNQMDYLVHDAVQPGLLVSGRFFKCEQFNSSQLWHLSSGKFMIK